MPVPTRARCPTCRKAVETAPETRPADYPFCSQRCRLLDLYRWLEGSYRIPVGQLGSDEEEE